MKSILGYFGSVPEAQRAINFLAGFPGVGGKKCFGIGKCKFSGFPSVFFDMKLYKQNCLRLAKPLDGSVPRFRPQMNVDQLRGAVHAYLRLMRKK